jgi:hypothetical protein
VFRLNTRGSVRVKAQDDAEATTGLAAGQIAKTLEAAYASEVWVEGRQVRFERDFFGRGWNWNMEWGGCGCSA